MKTGQVFVSGASVTMSWADAQRSLEELIFDGVTKALAACGVSMHEVDSVVLASHDLVDGRSLSSMVTAPAAGAYLRDEIRLAEDGLAALSLAAARVAAGESKLSVVAAWGRASEGDHVAVPVASMDPHYEQPLGLTESAISSLRFSRWLGTYGERKEEREHAARARRLRVARNPRAVPGAPPSLPVFWPMGKADAPPRADIVTATVLSAAEGPYRIAGIGHGTDLARLGDRDWLAQPALGAAVANAMREGKLSMADIDLFEIDGMTLPDEALALEALGLASPGRGFATYAGADHINSSGGSAAGWCYPAMGLVRFTEALLRLQGGKRRALAVGTAPVGAQTHTAVVLETV